MSEELTTIDFSQHANAGLENVTNQDLQIPFLQIAQTNSPEVNQASSEYDIKGIEGASPGDIFDTVSREVVGEFKSSLTVIPVSYEKAYVEWVPREAGGGMVQVHKNPSILNECSKNEKNKDVLPNGNIVEATAYHYLLYLKGDTWIKGIISMQSTQLKKSRAWLTKMSSIKMTNPEGGVYTPPMFSHKYDLSTVSESNRHGSWFGWKIASAGQLDDPEAYQYALASLEAPATAIESGDNPY